MPTGPEPAPRFELPVPVRVGTLLTTGSGRGGAAKASEDFTFIVAPPDGTGRGGRSHFALRDASARSG